MVTVVVAGEEKKFGKTFGLWGKKMKSVHLLPRAMTVGEQLKEILDFFYEGEYLKDIVIKHVSASDRRLLGLRGTTLVYPLLGDLLKVQRNPNECMIDFILYEAMRARVEPTDINRQRLYEAFGGKENVLANGVSIEQLELWLRTRDDISSYAIDEFDNVFSEFHCTRKEPKFYLVFKVNNEHVYAVLDPDVKDKVAHTKRLQLGDFNMSVDYDNAVGNLR